MTKVPYKHNQVNGIKKNPQNDPKMLCSSTLAIIRKLLYRQSSRNKIHEKIKNKMQQVINMR